MPQNKPRKWPNERARFPWLTGKKTRAERVIAFLEFLPITKGILRGEKMRLLPHQREFVERVYGGDVRLAISTIARGNGKTGLIAGLVCCHLFGPEAEPRGEIYSAACNIKASQLSSLPRLKPPSKRCLSSSSSGSRSTSFWKHMEVGAGPGEGHRLRRAVGRKGSRPRPGARHCGSTTSSALRRIGNCSTHYRRQAVSVTARSVSPLSRKRLTTGTRSRS